MTLKDDLVAAKALIDTPKKWVKSDSTKSCRRCAALACDRLVNLGKNSAGVNVDMMWGALYWQLPVSYQTDEDENGTCIGNFNDDHNTTHADVIALFDRAIQAAEGA